MLTSPPDIFQRCQELRRGEQSFVLATVIAVHGSSSAKTGSKAIFSAEGNNILGWVGGGCAESFLAREALDALKLQAPRVVRVDLDDEVFGLMPCGGTMDVYLEPHFPAATIELPDLGDWSTDVTRFVQQLGFQVAFREDSEDVKNWSDVFAVVAETLAAKFDRPLSPLRENGSNVPTDGDLYVIGQTRITEEFTRLASLLGWPVRPVSAQAAFTTKFTPRARVLVAGHSSKDHLVIARALDAGADYVGFVASRKRSGLMFEELKSRFDLDRVQAPCGLALPSNTPTQIAFSIACELLQRSGRWI